MFDEIKHVCFPVMQNKQLYKKRINYIYLFAVVRHTYVFYAIYNTILYCISNIIHLILYYVI